MVGRVDDGVKRSQVRVAAVGAEVEGEPVGLGHGGQPACRGEGEERELHGGREKSLRVEG